MQTMSDGFISHLFSISGTVWSMREHIDMESWSGEVHKPGAQTINKVFYYKNEQ